MTSQTSSSDIKDESGKKPKDQGSNEEVIKLISESSLHEVLNTNGENLEILMKHELTNQTILITVYTSLCKDENELAKKMADIVSKNFKKEDFVPGAVLTKVVDGSANSKFKLEVICSPSEDQLNGVKAWQYRCFEESFEDYKIFIEPELMKLLEERLDQSKNGEFIQSEMEIEGFEVFEKKMLGESQTHIILEVKDKSIKCLRDLNNSHLSLLKAAIDFKNIIGDKGQKYSHCAYIQYPAYHAPLRVHIIDVSQSFGQGMEYSEAREVGEVYERIQLCPEYYQKSILDVKVPVDPKISLFENFVKSKFK